MKKKTGTALLLLVFCMGLGAFYPDYYGARSLALGHSFFASDRDMNAIFMNPAFLAYTLMPVTGYQYQQTFQDYPDFSENLQQLLAFDLKNFEDLTQSQRESAFSILSDLYESPHGMQGSKCNLPGMAGRNLGFSVGWVKSAFISPGNNLLDQKTPDNLTGEDISGMKMQVAGFSYRQYSLAYALELSQTVKMGITLNYLRGKGYSADMAVTDGFFDSALDTSDYMNNLFGMAEKKFSRITSNASLLMNFNAFFRGFVLIKNIGSPKIKTPDRELELPQRIIAGISFRPSLQWTVYMNMDIREVDIRLDGEPMMPFSMGVEKSFSNNRFFVRGGIRNDLKEKYFFGKRSNIQYGLGLGFNMKRMIIDLGIGINRSGSVSSLAVSGYVVLN